MAYVSQRRQKIREEKAIIEQRKQTREQAKEQSVHPTESQGYVSERRQVIRESKAQVQPDVVAPETSVQTAQEPAKKSYAELHREYQAKEKGKAKTTTQEYKPLLPENVFYRDVVQKSIPNVKSQEKQPVDQSTQTKNLNFDDLRRMSDVMEKTIPPSLYHPEFESAPSTLPPKVSSSAFAEAPMRETVGTLETIGGLALKGIAGKEPSKIGDYQLKPDIMAPVRQAGEKLIQVGAKEFEAAEEIRKAVSGDSKAAQFATGILMSIPDMVISAAISGATAGTGGVAKLTAKEIAKGLLKKETRKEALKYIGKNAIKALTPELSTLPLGAKSFANTYHEAVNMGADEDRAIAAALLSSYIESLIEKGGVQKAIKEGTFGQTISLFRDGFGEGMEEFWQGFLSPAAMKYIAEIDDIPVYGEGGIVDPKRSLQETISGIVLAFGMSGIGRYSNSGYEANLNLSKEQKPLMKELNKVIDEQRKKVDELTARKEVLKENVDAELITASYALEQLTNIKNNFIDQVLSEQSQQPTQSEETRPPAAQQEQAEPVTPAVIPAIEPKETKQQKPKSPEQRLDEAIKQQQAVVDDLSYRKFYLEHDVEAELEAESVKLEELKAQKEKLLADRQAEAQRAQRAYDYEQGNISLEQIMSESEVRDTKTDPKTITVNKVTTVRSEPKIDKTYRQQYNNIDEIKTQISKYYDNVPDVNKELVDSGAQAIADLQKTENLYRGVPEKLTGVQNDLRGDSGALPGQKPYKTIGKAFSNDLINTGKVNLTGVTFNNIEDLAVLSQVYRDPRFETFRIIYTKGNSIVGTDAITSRMPGSAVVFLGSNKSQHFNRISDRMKRMQADGYYLLHNHPGKTTKPSRSDLVVTQTYAKNISGFKGHLIINSNKYTEIYQDAGFMKGNEDMPLSLGDDLLYNPAIEHPLLNKEIDSSVKLAQIAKQVQLDKEVSIAFFTDAKNTVRGILEINNSMIKNAEKDNFRNFLRNQATELGGRKVLMVGSKTVKAELVDLIKNGDIIDGIIENEFGSIAGTLPSIRNQDAENLWMGKDASKGKALRPAKPSETIYKKPELIIPPTTLAIKKPAIKPETIKTITGHEDVLPETKPVGVVPERSIQGERFIPQKETLDDSVAQLEAAPTKAIQRITGNTIKAYDNDNKGYEFKYAVVSADDLIASHDTNMNQNPSYPQELQPRDRERIASKIQVDKMAFNIQPELLGESPKIQDGAPIIGKDNIVESGNGRVIALKKMYQTTKANKEKYINWLKDNAEKFGIDVSKLPENPVLVRVRQTDVNRNEFVKKANEASVALMSSTETAKSDAERLTDRILGLFEASEDGTINTVGNRPFISAFTREIIPDNEVGRYVTPEGYLSQDGMARVRNAIFYKAYGSDRLLTKISESTDNNIKNITNSLINVAPKIIKIKDGINRGVYYDIDYSADIIGAVEQYLNLKNSKLSVDEYLQQQTLFDDGVSQSAKVILGVIDENSRSAKKITEFLNTVLDAVEELGNPDQVSLFGEQTDISKGELIKYAYRRFDDGGQQTLEQITEDRPGERQEDKRISRPKDGRQKTEGKREKSEEVNTLTSSASVSLPQGTNTGVFAKTMDDLVEIIENFTGVPIRTGKFKQRALGIFKVQSEVIRTKIKNDLPVICHELGHYLDKKHGFYGSKIHDSELIPLGRQTSRASYSQTAIRKEGVAEFLRIYLTDHIRAKNIAPSFLAHFESVIGYDELNFLSQLRTDVTSIINLKPENRVYNSVSSYEGRTTITKKAPLFHRLINQWIDKEAVVGRIQKEAEKKGYTGTNIKTTFENLRGLDAQVETMIMDNQRDVNGKVIFKSLAEIFEPISKKACKKLGYDPVQVREHFIAYMVSRRAMDYRARNLTMPDTWATYQDTITRLESKYGKLFTDLFDDIRKWEDNSLEMLVESGIKSRQEIKMIKILNANHIPLQRIQETIDVIRAGSGSSVGQSKQVVKRAVGSGATIIDPIESIITNAFIITRAAKSNNALRALKNMTSIDGMGKWIEAVPNKTHSENFSVKDVRTQMIKIAKANNDINLEEALKNMTDEELESGLSIFYTLPKEGDKEITIYENGKGRLYEVDAELYKAIKGLNKEQSNIVIRILNMPKRVLQFGVVTTVEFMIRNMNRDTFTSLIQSDVAINPVEIIKGYISAFKKDSDYRELVAMGGATEFLNIRSRTEAQKLEDKVLGYGFAEKFKRFAANVAEVRINNNQRTRAKLVQSISTLVGTIPDAIRSLVDWSEMGPRVAEYRKALAKGYSKEEATALARKVTQDFLRSGYYGKEVSKVTAFFNANIQGTTRQVETFAQNPGRTLLRGFAYITLPTLLLYFINYDDEDYQALPNWRKTLFWNIPIGDRKFFSIPRPYGYSFIFGAVPEIVLDKVLVDDIKTFERIKESFIQNFDIPVIPSALKPAIEVKANKQWNDTPIEGTWDRVNYPAYLIRNEKTSTISKALGDFFKNEEGLSPKQIDYLIKGYFGSVGEFIYRTPDTIKDGVEMPADWTDLPIIKEFITDSVYTNDNINTLYDYSSELTKRAKEYKQTGEYPSLEKIENKKRKEKILNELDNLRLESNQVIAKLTDERKAIKTIEADKKLSASIREAKAREIRYWMNKEAEAFNKKYELLKKKYNLK